MIVLKILNINFTLSLGHCVSVLSQFLQRVESRRWIAVRLTLSMTRPSNTGALYSCFRNFDILGLGRCTPVFEILTFSVCTPVFEIFTFSVDRECQNFENRSTAPQLLGLVFNSFKK